MKSTAGFTLIEVLVLIVVTSILATTILLGLITAGKNIPAVANNSIADQAAKGCIEWFLGQRRLLGYSAVTCPSTSVPSFCNSPAGYTLSVNVTCTTINTDTHYQTITVSVSGSGNASLSTLIASY
jgi:type II secretory pathway pseudopilin PulG